MARWLPFSVLVVSLTLVLLVLARRSQATLSSHEPDSSDAPAEDDETGEVTTVEQPVPTDHPESERQGNEGIELTPAALLANVALTQGLVAVLVVGAGWYFAIPPSSFGVAGEPTSTGLPAVGLGLAFGVALWLGSEFSAAVADAVGTSYDEQLRETLSPESTGGWAVLFGFVLPIIAASEELLFRAALIGVPAAGFGVSPWLLAVVSSVAFALGHGAQGRVGVVVTGFLGLFLAAGYVVSGSLLLVVVAHYVVNALEFFVHEFLDAGPLFPERGSAVR